MLDYYPAVSFIFKILCALPLIHIAFGKLYSLLCQPCSASELELITSEVFANVPKMPRRVELMLSLICVNPEISMGHTLLVLRRIKISTLQLCQKREVNERLCIEEVGVDLELCVHAHRHDVDLIMEASLIIKCSLGISSSCICKLILCNRGSDHIFSLIPFPGQVKILVFCRSFHLSNLYFDLPRVLPPVISRILCHCTTSCEFSLE